MQEDAELATGDSDSDGEGEAVQLGDQCTVRVRPRCWYLVVSFPAIFIKPDSPVHQRCDIRSGSVLICTGSVAQLAGNEVRRRIARERVLVGRRGICMRTSSGQA